MEAKTKRESVSAVSTRPYKGFVYNVTTETGNVFVENILVHNSGGLGTPAHLRVECLTEGSLVSLQNGDVVEVEKLLERSVVNSVETVGDAKVYGVSGVNLLGFDEFKTKEARVYRIVERNVNSKLFRIKTRFGELLEVTGNHPIATMSKDGIVFVPAEKLSGKESLVKPRSISSETAVPTLPVFEKAEAHNAIRLVVKEVNQDFCYWLGGMFSEGDFTSFQYSNSNRYLCQEMVDCFERVTGIKSTVYQRKNGHFFASFNKKELSNLTFALGLNGKTAKKKEIPTMFMSSPRNLCAPLLAGLFDGDGSITEDGEISYATASKKLAFQVKNLLLKFGIQSTVSWRKQSWNSYTESEIFKVRTMGREPITVFFEEIPLKRKELKAHCLEYLQSTGFSKTMKRKTVPLLMPVLDRTRKKLFLVEDEVLPQRIFANYDRSDPSFDQLNKIIEIFEKRTGELQQLFLLAEQGDWAQLRAIAKKLHLGFRKVRKLSGKDFRWGYRTNASTLRFFRNFFSNLCRNVTLEVGTDLGFIKKIATGEMGFDAIASIEQFDYKGRVFDVTTSTSNFFAQGLLVHNCGLIHKANGGVLFLDEIATLSSRGQQELLTAMQEKKYSISGQSENSSGAMTRTDPVPCDFVLVAAGNYVDLQKVHPALRSRIRGYGYEVYMNIDMPDTEENRKKIAQFVAQEVKKDAKVPHFSAEAVQEIVFEARRRAGRKNRLTLKLRDLGGLVRAAGDLAKEKGHSLVMPEDVFEAKMSARTLEQQMVGQMLEMRKDYNIYLTEGSKVGRVNGLAVSGDGDAGLILPIEAEIAPAQSSAEGKIIATGKLGAIAKEAVQNVSALIKKLSGKDIAKFDLHIQFLQTYEGVEGDSASVSVATAVISAMEGIPVRQDLAMTGSLSVRGEVLPVGGVTAKVSSAIRAGFREVIVPKSNMEDIVLSEEERKRIKIVPVETLSEVLLVAFEKGDQTKRLLASLKKVFSLDLKRMVKPAVQ